LNESKIQENRDKDGTIMILQKIKGKVVMARWRRCRVHPLALA
jgi:hypothetical protein